jgi:hypothetical protein
VVVRSLAEVNWLLLPAVALLLPPTFLPYGITVNKLMLTIVLGKTHLLSKKIMLVLHHYIKHYAIVTLGLTRLVLFLQ